MYFGLFFFFNGPFVQANTIKYDNTIYKDFFSVSGNSNIFFHKDSYFVGFDYLSSFYKKKVFSVYNSIKSSNNIISFFSFLYKSASIRVFLNSSLFNIKSTGSSNNFYHAFLNYLKNKTNFNLVDNASAAFLRHSYINTKRSSVSILSANSNQLTTSFLRYIILVSFFLRNLFRISM
jgi:hypothetical protein